MNVSQTERRFRYIGYLAVGTAIGAGSSGIASTTYRLVTHNNDPTVPLLIDWGICTLASCASFVAARNIGRIKRNQASPPLAND